VAVVVHGGALLPIRKTPSMAQNSKQHQGPAACPGRTWERAALRLARSPKVFGRFSRPSLCRADLPHPHLLARPLLQTDGMPDSGGPIWPPLNAHPPVQARLAVRGFPAGREGGLLAFSCSVDLGVESWASRHCRAAIPAPCRHSTQEAEGSGSPSRQLARIYPGPAPILQRRPRGGAAFVKGLGAAQLRFPACWAARAVWLAQASRACLYGTHGLAMRARYDSWACYLQAGCGIALPVWTARRSPSALASRFTRPG